MEPIGKTAYEAYRQYIATAEAGKDVRTGSLEWDELEVTEREAWQAAADAVVELYA